jgi:hypothetical protein
MAAKPANRHGFGGFSTLSPADARDAGAAKFPVLSTPTSVGAGALRQPNRRALPLTHAALLAQPVGFNPSYSGTLT